MKLVDLKGTITRLDAALERTEALRPRLTAEAAEALDTLQRHARRLRDGMDELTATVPAGVVGVDEIPMGAEEQQSLDASVVRFNRISESLEGWLEEWNA